MSIEIRPARCVGCGACAIVCPGSLIRMKDGTASIPRPERCWGCASCVKACKTQAIALFLGNDIGGLGGNMTVKQEQALLCWTIHLPDGTEKTIVTDSRDANQY